MARNPPSIKSIVVLIVASGLLFIGIGITMLTARGVAAQAGDPVRGGQLYDTWWVVLDVDVPAGDQPLWATQDTNTRSGADTWRCKECHGWDYLGADGAYGSGSHFTGFPGILGAEDPAAALTMPDHDFSTVMDEQALADLAAFITTSLIDANALIGAGDAGTGELLYAEVCINCHGPNGNAINFGALDDPEFIGHLGTDNPWELIHKVRYGQPGQPMPSGINNGWTEADVANVLAYAETLPLEPALSGGGPLYDAWWVVLGVDIPAGDQPLWATQDTNTRSGADTWRCKECHGWDYRGADGAYSSGSHLTGFPGVLGAADPVAALALPDHDFSALMDEAALDALVTFMQEEMTDITEFVNDDGTVNGDPRFGRDLFSGTCAACHGVDGRAMNFGDEEEPEFLGTIAVDNPWEFFHKASFGQPGEPMPAGLALGWTRQDIADILAFVQTLPTE